ncbi:hypothetical protein LSAT2_004382, partial [Lamellibrachia satsuma]
MNGGPGCGDPCMDQPCQNDGTCQDNGDGTRTCFCHSNYIGQDCQSSGCDRSVCFCNNGGTCVDNYEECRCSCDTCHAGEHCDLCECFMPVN